MFETISVPRKVIETNVNDAFPFVSKVSDISDIKQYRERISEYKEYRIQCFDKGFRVSDLLMSQTKSLDDFLSKIFEKYTDLFDYLALVAVGGYGRREQFLESDIDLLIVSQVDPIPSEAKEAIEKFISFLWDLKLDLGTSVRTINETILASRDDITIITNLIETHFIAGNQTVYENLIQSITEDDFWDNEKYFDAKVKEQNERYHAFRDTIYSLEPDIKNNPGGLRDLHIMQWLALKIYHLGKYDNLHTIGLLTKEEYDEYLACRDFLWDVRYAIHCNSNTNILRLDFQKSIAKTLGYGEEGNAPVEAMMRDLYRIFHRVLELNNMVLQQVSIDIKGYVGDEFSEPVFLNNAFVQRGQYIDVIDHEIFKNDPEKMLDLFLAIGSHPEINKIHVNCLRALREGRRELKDHLITIPNCRKKFKQILTSTESLPLVLRLMHETHVLSSYMPQWARIEGLAQFDRFHLFSVDEHTIRVLSNLNELALKRDPIYQLFKNVRRKIADPEILFCAALLHDIAKGRGGSHAAKGAKEAEAFCVLHEFNEYQTNLISWLVGAHLMFNTTATRRDTTDLEVINSFADFVQDEEHLNHLYCLTVADISATNDNVWNSWQDNIFRQLYQATKLAVTQSEADLVKSMLLQANEKRERAIEITKDCKKDDLLRYMRQFPNDYFIHYSVEDISWHARNILRYRKNEEPLILFSQTPNVGTELLFYYKSTSPSMFTNLVITMAVKQMNVFSAQIFLTHDFHALCTIMFQNKKGQPLDHDRLNGLRKAILAGLKEDSQVLNLSTINRKIFEVPTTISYLDSKSEKQTKLEISTLDRQGLLAKIGITLGNLGCLIRAARITTTGERADDYFAITDSNGLPLDASRKEELSIALKKALDE